MPAPPLVKVDVGSAGNETVTDRMAGARPPAYWWRLASAAPEMKPSHGLLMTARSLVEVGVDIAGNETPTARMAGV